MQPYSELANWDGSLSATNSRSTTEPPPSSASPPVNNLFRDMVDPLPTDPTTLPLSLHEQHDAHPHLHAPSQYDLYPKLSQTNHQQRHHQDHRTVAPHPQSLPHITSASASSSLSCAFGQPSSSIDRPLFLPNGHGHGHHAREEDSVLSPQEREIMADITLDPDDDDDVAWAWTTGAENNVHHRNRDHDASAAKFENHKLKVGDASTSANVFQSKSLPVTTASQRHLLAPLLPRPQPPAPIASTSTSVSPSPFAPLPSKSSSSSPSHPATKEAPEMGHRTHTGSEYVIMHATTASRGVETGHGNSSRDASQSAAGGVQETAAVDSPLDPYPPSQQSLVPTRRSSSSKSSRDSQRRLSKTPLFLPSPTESVPPSRHPSDPPSSPDRPSEPPDIISITSSSSASPPPRPPRRSPRKKLKAKQGQERGQGRQLMAYVLVPPLPPGARKSDYVPLEELLRMRDRRDGAKGKARAGDNSGSSALAAALQGAFENNASASSAERPVAQNARRRLRRGDKQKEVVPVEVTDDEGEDEHEGEARNKGSVTLAHALSAAFAHNSANPNVAASLVEGASGSTRQLRISTRAEAVSDSTGVETVPPPPAKHSRGRPRPRATTNADNDKNKLPPTPTSSRRNEKRQPLTPSSPRGKRRRLARRGEGADAHDAEDDGEMEIVESSPQLLRRSPRSKSHSKADPPRRKPNRTSQQQRNASMPTVNPISAPASEHLPSPTPPLQLPPATPPLRGELPLTILPVPSPADIVIPARALYNLHSSPGGGGEGADTSGALTQHGSLQGFHGEEAAVGAHGLLVSLAAAATIVDNSVRATMTTTTDDDLHHPSLDLSLDIDVPMDLGDAGQEQAQERQDPVRAAVVPSHALRISSTTHPDGPMLGFALSEHELEGAPRSSLSADPDTDASSDGFGLGFGVNTGPDMDFMLASLNPCFNDGAAGSIDWGAAAGPSTGLVPEGEYVGDGTIDPSVLGGPGPGSPYKVFRSDAAVASVRGRVVVRAVDASKKLDDVGDEGDIEGPLFQDSTDGEFVPLLDKGKGKINGVRGAARRIGARDSRIRTKSWRRTLADENGESEDNTEAEVDENAAEMTKSTSVATTYCHHCRRKTRRPKMRCTRIRESTGVQCCKLYCDLCIEKRYPDLKFDEFATTFLCPSCQDTCNCSLCSRARGEAYIPERNGGWRKWVGRLDRTASITTSDGPSQPPQRKEPRRDGDVVGSVEDARPPVSGLGTQNATTKFTLTGEPRDKATAMTRTVPTQISTPPSSMPASASASTTAIAKDAPPSPSPSQHKTRRRYVYIGKRPKAWGRLVSVPDPEEQQQARKNGQRKRKRKRGRRGLERMFVGSEEPLLLARKRQRAKKERRQDYSSAASLPPSSSPTRAGHGGDMNGDGDADGGVWPGEYPVPLSVVGAVGKAVLRITPEEVERAIGAAFAVGSKSIGSN